MKKLEIVKMGVKVIVSVGIGAIVGNAVKATTPEGISKISKICVALGTTVLTGITTAMASNYTENQINEIVDQFKKSEEDPITEEE